MNIRFFIGVAYVAAIGILSNVVAIFIPRDRLREDKFPFKPFRWEREGRIYDRLAIRKWKSKVPDMSKILKFLLPKKVQKGVSSEDLCALIKETVVAEIVHVALSFLSLAVLFICPTVWGVVLFFLCLLFNLPFIVIQRYNRPQYITAAKRLRQREEKRRQCLS